MLEYVCKYNRDELWDLATKSLGAPVGISEWEARASARFYETDYAIRIEYTALEKESEDKISLIFKDDAVLYASWIGANIHGIPNIHGAPVGFGMQMQEEARMSELTQKLRDANLKKFGTKYAAGIVKKLDEKANLIEKCARRKAQQIYDEAVIEANVCRHQIADITQRYPSASIKEDENQISFLED